MYCPSVCTALWIANTLLEHLPTVLTPTVKWLYQTNDDQCQQTTASLIVMHDEATNWGWGGSSWKTRESNDHRSKRQVWFIGSEKVYHFSSSYNFALLFTIRLHAAAVAGPGTWTVLWVLIRFDFLQPFVVLVSFSRLWYFSIFSRFTFRLERIKGDVLCDQSLFSSADIRYGTAVLFFSLLPITNARKWLRTYVERPVGVFNLPITASI